MRAPVEGPLISLHSRTTYVTLGTCLVVQGCSVPDSFACLLSGLLLYCHQARKVDNFSQESLNSLGFEERITGLQARTALMYGSPPRA